MTCNVRNVCVPRIANLPTHINTLTHTLIHSHTHTHTHTCLKGHRDEISSISLIIIKVKLRVSTADPPRPSPSHLCALSFTFALAKFHSDKFLKNMKYLEAILIIGQCQAFRGLLFFTNYVMYQ